LHDMYHPYVWVEGYLPHHDTHHDTHPPTPASPLVLVLVCQSARSLMCEANGWPFRIRASPLAFVSPPAYVCEWGEPESHTASPQTPARSPVVSALRMTLAVL